jgi:acyl-[acyl-carrier-protein] desaturase
MEPSPLAVLAPVASKLLDRHVAAAKEWFPHEMVPWGRGRDIGQAEEQSAPVLEPGVASALFVNLLTEDNLPFYMAGLISVAGTEEPWWDWIRRWTAEEMRHATVIRDYVSITHSIDLVALERARMAHILDSEIPSAGGPLDAFVYLTLQELSTRIAHRNTGDRLDDEDGRRIMTRVAMDENLHFLFYRDLVSEALEIDPSGVVLAIERQVRYFAMPGVRIPGFAEHARAIAGARIFSAEILLEQVLVPVVLRQWKLEQVESLSSDAERARDRTLRYLERFERAIKRLAAASASASGSASASADTEPARVTA